MPCICSICHKNVPFIVLVEDCQISGALCVCVCVCGGGALLYLQATQKRLCSRTITHCRERERGGGAILCALGVVEFVHKWNEHMHSSFACYLQERGSDTVCDITGDGLQGGRRGHTVVGPLLSVSFVSASLQVVAQL